MKASKKTKSLSNPAATKVGSASVEVLCWKESLWEDKRETVLPGNHVIDNVLFTVCKAQHEGPIDFW